MTLGGKPMAKPPISAWDTFMDGFLAQPVVASKRPRPKHKNKRSVERIMMTSAYQTGLELQVCARSQPS
jgi:hypothetical protein